MNAADLVNAAVWLVALLVIVAVMSRLRQRRRHVGAAAVGTVYEMLNEDKRRAIEIVVEEKAGEVDPERADGNLPDLHGRG